MKITPELKPRLRAKGLEPCYFLDSWLSTHYGVRNGSWTGLKEIGKPFVNARIHIHFMGGGWYSNFSFYIYRLRVSLNFNNEH